MHGGAAGHVREAAKRRLEALVEPSISKLRVLMLRGESHAIQLKAAESILDRAGIVAEQKIELDNQVSITVSYQDVEMAKQVINADMPGVVYEALPEPSNGQNGHVDAEL